MKMVKIYYNSDAEISLLKENTIAMLVGNFIRKMAGIEK